MRRLAFAAALLALALPVGAQTLGTISIEAADGGVIAPGAAGSLEATVEIACALIVEASGERGVTVTGESVAFTVQEGSFEISPEACLTGSGSVSQVVNLTLTPRAGAEALLPHPVNLTASLGAFTASDEATATVAYEPGHRIEPDITFPATVRGDSLTFNVTIHFTGNARTMVMFADERCQGCSVSGLMPVTAVPPTTETIQVTFDAPDGVWENRTFEFRHFSHWSLESGAGDPVNEKVESWTFVQAEEGQTGGNGGDEDSPAVGILLAAAVLGLALIVRRRL